MRTRLGILAASASLIAGMSGAAIADPGDAPSPGSAAAFVGQEARAEQAKDALAKVESIFDGAGDRAGRSKAAAHAHGRSATMALRDLVLLKDALTGEDLSTAERYLARPTQGGGDPGGDGYTVAEATPACGTYVCIHYVTSTVDAPPLADTSPANGIPDSVEFARDTMDFVHASYVAAGYRAPKSDIGSSPNGGDAKPDVYLAQIGDDSLYGYCTTDDPTVWPNGGSNLDVSAYCVLDDDFAEFVTPSITAAEALQATAAHEYMHAVQYAYDIWEDGWFMEASATWAEDELFDDVNDNVYYLAAGQMGRPWIPLDTYGDSAHYGNWIFLRYLTEKYAGETGGMPTIMKELWERADAAGRTSIGGVYAISAIKAELAQRGTSFTAQYALFSDALRRPGSFEEGNSQHYAPKPLAGTRKLSTSKKSTGWLTISQDHLTSDTLRVVPTDTLAAKAWRLRVQLDMAPTKRGTAAVVTVYKQGGGVAVQRVSLNSEGNKTVTVKFGKAEVKAVEITWVNASTRFANCFTDPDSAYSCYGESKDDNLKPLVRATAFR